MACAGACYDMAETMEYASLKRVQNIVQTVPSIYSLPLIFVLVVVKGFALNPRKENHDPLQ